MSKQLIKKYDKRGAVGAEALITVAVVAFVLIMFAVVAGRAYSTQESSINAISDSNVKAEVKETAINGFAAMSDLTGLLTIFGLLVVLLILIGGIYSIMSISGGGGGGSRVL